MPSMTNTQPTKGLLKITGPDAKKFLQGQLTCNLDEVSETQSRLGAHCNPQGRVLFLFRIYLFSAAYYLVMPREMVGLALQALNKYAKFFKLQLEDASDTAESTLQALTDQEWAFFNPLQGIPQVYPATSGLFLPHELGLPERGGISWNKGCYTGQEIIARMQYRGKLKNHLYLAKIQSPKLPQLGANLFSLHETGPVPAGQVVDFREQSYNIYIVLLLTQENSRSTLLRLDPHQNEIWEWLTNG